MTDTHTLCTHAHTPAIIIKPLTGQLSNSDYFITMAQLIRVGCNLAESEQSVLDVDVLEVGKIGNCKRSE